MFLGHYYKNFYLITLLIVMWHAIYAEMTFLHLMTMEKEIQQVFARKMGMFYITTSAKYYVKNAVEYKPFI